MLQITEMDKVVYDTSQNTFKEQLEHADGWEKWKDHD